MFTNISRQTRVLNVMCKQFRKVRSQSLTTTEENILRSRLPDVTVPDLSVPELIFRNSNKWSSKIATECQVTGRKYTYEQLRIKSRNLAKALKSKLKLKSEDVVAICLYNCPEYPICLLGVIQTDLIATTINPIYTAEEIYHQLEEPNVKVVFTFDTTYPTVEAAVKKLPHAIPIIVIKSEQSSSIPAGTIDFFELINTDYGNEDLPRVDNQTLAVLPYSSGTTGKPKGVELTHYNLVANMSQIDNDEVRLNYETTENYQDVIPVVLPMFHIFGMVILTLNGLMVGGKLPTLPKFTPELYISMLIKQKPTILYLVPPMVRFLTEHPAVKKEYLTSVHTILSGAAPLGQMDEQKFLEKADKDIAVLQGYGLTETSPVVAMVQKNRWRQLQIGGSVGEIVGSTQVKITPPENPAHPHLGPGEPGEILVKGPQVTRGYYNKPQQTEDAFHKGWFRTGDMAYYDENGLLFITDRLKELIKVKGFQVAPAELEEIIRHHPDVADAAVIGIPHEAYGEVPRAYIVPKESHKIKTASINEFVNSKVAPYKQLKGGIAVVDNIPKTVSGKIMRKELKQHYLHRD